MKTKAIVFDMDGVLVNTDDFIEKAFLHVFEKYGIKNVPLDFFERYVGEALTLIYQKLAPGFDVEVLCREHVEWQNTHHDKLIKFYPDIKSTLEELKRKRIKLAILTSRSGESTLRSLKKAEIIGYFDHITRCEDISKPKPDPEGLNKAVARMGIDKDSVLYVGDTGSDAKAAKRAGVKFVAAAYGHVKEKVLKYNPDYSINNFFDILRLVK